MSLEMSLIELYNPLYLLPIVGVVFCALLVYAFGFKSTTLPPNFDDLDDSKKVTTKKKKVEKSLKSTTGKAQQNGHVNTGAAKVQEKKPVQKKETKSPVAEAKASDKVVDSNKVSAKKDKSKNKNKPNAETQDLDDKDSGEWVELISKKERKSRKQKEEQMLNEVQETSLATNVKTKSLTSPKKQSKKGKENKEKTEKKSLDSNVGKTKNTGNKNKESGVNVENDKNAKKQNAKDEDLIAEDPDIYELVKDRRQPDKMQKNRKDKRNSESEVAPKLESIAETETNVNQTDKLTASIVANYEAADQNKPDSLSTANNKKKKDKNKKKQTLTNATNNKVIEKDNKTAPTPVKDTPVQKSDNPVNIPNNTNEVKPSEDDDFKVTVSKKRRARRE